MAQAVWKIYDHATYTYEECFRRNITDALSSVLNELKRMAKQQSM